MDRIEVLPFLRASRSFWPWSYLKRARATRRAVQSPPLPPFTQTYLSVCLLSSFILQGFLFLTHARTSLATFSMPAIHAQKRKKRREEERMKKNKSINKCLLAFPRCQCESAYVRARVAVQGFRKAPHNTKPSERATRTVSQSICAFPPFPHSVHIRGKVCTEAKPKVNRGRFGRCVIAAGANDTTIVSEGEKEVRM